MMQQSEEWLSRVGQLVRPSQIIAAALMSGVLVFVIISVVVRGGELTAQIGMLTLLAAFFAVVMAVASTVAIPVIDGAARRKIPLEASNAEEWMAASRELAQAFQMRTILSFALLEGAAFFNLVVVLIDGSIPSLGIAAALLMLMATRFPTRLKFVSWLERQVRAAKEEQTVAR